MHDAKQAAITQWTSDPCGPDTEAEAGTRTYFEQLDAGRHSYAPWMNAALGYEHTGGLDVLDVGCGQGIDLARYARAGARVYGVDLTPRHVELAREHLAAFGLDGEVWRGDAEALPFADASFDRVSSNGVLHHTPDMLAALKEIRRVLRPGGISTIIVYNHASLHYWLGQVMQQGIMRGMLFQERSMAGVMSRSVERTSIDARPLVRVYSPWVVRRLMREAGFSDVSTKVRHLRATDTLPTRLLAGQPRVLDRLGRRVGWYVVGRGSSE